MIQVVDASAFAAVLFGENAEFWVRERTRGQTLIAPALLEFEIGNVYWKRMRQFPESADRFTQILSAWLASTVIRVEAVDALGTLDLAREHSLTFYDASYLWLAQSRTAELISLDMKLVRAARRLGLDAPTPITGAGPQTTPRSRN